MIYIVLTLCLAVQVNSYVLLQVRKDDQNRSNVDALIHKVVPSGQFEALSKNIARKQFSAHVPRKSTSKTDVTELSGSMENKIDAAIKEFVEKKPVLRSHDFTIKPKLINFRSNQEPSLMYEVDSKVIIRALQDFLSSQLVAKYTEEAAKRAASAYKSLRRQLNIY